MHAGRIAAVKKQEISSTEKLLELIKSDSRAPQPDGAAAPGRFPSSSPSRRQSFLGRLSPRAPEITVGVDIGPGYLKLAKTAPGPDNGWRLLDLLTVPFDPEISRESPLFHKFLQTHLHRFCGSTKKLRIWASISSINVEVRPVTIPKVPKRMVANSVFWTFKKEVPFNEKEMVFDYEFQGETIDSGVKKMTALAFIAPKQEIKVTRDLFVKSGYPLTGLTITPFALQNLFRIDNNFAPQAALCNLYIGRDWSRIDLYANHTLALIRGVKTGINSMVEGLVEGFDQAEGPVQPAERPPSRSPGLENEESGADFPAQEENSPVVLELLDSEEEESAHPPAMVPASPAHRPVTAAEARKILFSQCDGCPPLTPEDPGYRLSGDRIFAMIQPAVERLIRQVERTFTYYTSSFPGVVLTRIYLTGQLCTHERLAKHIGDQLAIPSTVLDPFETKGMVPVNFRVPETVPERVAYGPAVGLALSNNNRTPNFLFTRQDKEKLAGIAKVDRFVFAVFLLLVALGVAGYAWQNRVIEQERLQLATLQEQLSRYAPEVDRDILTRLVGQAGLKQSAMKTYQKRYQGLAVIGELAALTPRNIALRSCDIILAQPENGEAAGGTSAKKGGEKPGTKQKLILDGYLTAENQRLESSLASYLMRLANSPLFDQPVVTKSTVEETGSRDGTAPAPEDKREDRAAWEKQEGSLHFIVQLDIL